MSEESGEVKLKGMMRKCENEVRLSGWVGKDPEVKNLRGEKVKAEFSMATRFSWKDKNTGEWNETTEWHQIEAWGYIAKRIEKWFRKGMFVHVRGTIQTKNWTNEQGEKKRRTLIKAVDLWVWDRMAEVPNELVTDSDGQDENQEAPGDAGRGDYGNPHGGPPAQGPAGDAQAKAEDDDLPF